MKIIFALILLGSAFYSTAQFTPQIFNPRNFDREYKSPFEQKIKKHRSYKLNVWKYIYEVKMKDGSTLKANSDVLLDNVSKKYFLYYLKGIL